MKKALIIIGTIAIILVPMVVYGATPGIDQYPELQKAVNFINFIINVVRFGAGSVAGLIATITGWQMLTNDRGLEIAKKNFKNAAYAVFFIFFGNHQHCKIIIFSIFYKKTIDPAI